MKKIISITIALCLVFCSILPVYAEAWNNQQAYIVTSNSTGILSQITNLNSLFTQFFTIRNISGGNVTATFQDFYDLFASLCAWIIPSNPSQTGLSLWDFSLLIAQRVNDLWGGWDSYFSNLTAIPVTNTLLGTNNNLLTLIKNGTIGNQLTPDSSGNYSSALVRQYAHLALLDNYTGAYTLNRIMENGSVNGATYNYLSQGSPIGNLMLGLKLYLFSFANAFRYNKEHFIDVTADNKWLYHATDNLTTWDSQGSTLTQVAFTPESLAQGLYRYLAFTQRDVARLAYVFANDEELEARQLAQANQEQIIDDFIDPNGSGSVSTTDFNAMAGASDSVKDNFNTGYSSSNVWDIFNSDHYGWFSQECADSLDTSVSNTRTLKSGSGYQTPLLDSYYEQILSLGGDN